MKKHIRILRICLITNFALMVGLNPEGINAQETYFELKIDGTTTGGLKMKNFKTNDNNVEGATNISLALSTSVY